MEYLNNKEAFEAKKRLKTFDNLTAVHSKELVLDAKNLYKENFAGKKTQINYLCDFTNNSINNNLNEKDFHKNLNNGSATVKINLEQPGKCKEINLEHENNESLPKQSNTWWLYENYFLSFFLSNVNLICKGVISPISLLPYVLSILLSFYFYLKSPKVYKKFIDIVNLLAFVVTSVCCLDFMFRFKSILNDCEIGFVGVPIYTTLLLSILFLLILNLPRKRFKFTRSCLIIPIFALYFFFMFLYFDFLTANFLVLGLGVMVVINLETEIYSNEYKNDLIYDSIRFGLGNFLLGLCHCVFSLYFLHSKGNFN